MQLRLSDSLGLQNVRMHAESLIMKCLCGPHLGRRGREGARPGNVPLPRPRPMPALGPQARAHAALRGADTIASRKAYPWAGGKCSARAPQGTDTQMGREYVARAPLDGHQGAPWASVGMGVWRCPNPRDIRRGRARRRVHVEFWRGGRANPRDIRLWTQMARLNIIISIGSLPL